MPSYAFGARDAQIAERISASSWGSLIDLNGISTVTFSEQTTSAVLTGDDEELAVHAKPLSVELQIQFAFTSLEPFEVITGRTMTSNSDYEEIILQPGINYPYFAFIGKAEFDDGTGQFELFFPMIKLMSGFSMSFQYGQWMTPQLTFKAVSNGSPWYVGSMKRWLDGTRALTIPPSYT